MDSSSFGKWMNVPYIHFSKDCISSGFLAFRCMPGMSCRRVNADKTQVVRYDHLGNDKLSETSSTGIHKVALSHGPAGGLSRQFVGKRTPQINTTTASDDVDVPPLATAQRK